MWGVKVTAGGGNGPAELQFMSAHFHTLSHSKKLSYTQLLKVFLFRVNFQSEKA